MALCSPEVNKDLPAASFLVLNIDDRYVLGMQGIKPGGSVIFNTRERIGPKLFLKWKDTALFNGKVTIGEPVHIKGGTKPGRYLFGIEGQEGFPFCIGVEFDGRISGTFMVCRDLDRKLNLRVCAFVPQNNPLVTFREDYESTQTTEIVEIFPLRKRILKLDQSDVLKTWRVEPNEIGSVVLSVHVPDGVFRQMGGGEEAEIEIIPPMEVAASGNEQRGPFML